MEQHQNPDTVIANRRPTGICSWIVMVIYVLGLIIFGLCPVFAQIIALLAMTKYKDDEFDCIFRPAYNRVYGKTKSNPISYIMSHVVLLVVSLLTHVPIFIIYILATNWNNKNSCIKQTVRTIGTLVIGNLYYEMVTHAHKWVYFKEYTDDVGKSKDPGCGWRWLGHLFLTIGTLGLYLVWVVTEAIYIDGWNNKNVYKKQIARTIGTLIIGNLWYESICYAHRSIYPSDHSQVSWCHQFMGHIAYSICTLGLFIPVRIIQLLYWNWDSDSTCRKQTVRTIGTLIIGNLYYESICYAHRSVYPSKVRVTAEEGATRKVSMCHQFMGHIVYTICTLGLFIPVRIIQLLCWNWNSDSTCKSQTARTIGTLIIGNLWYESIQYADRSVYPPDVTVEIPATDSAMAATYRTEPKKVSLCHQFMGHIVYAICTLGLFIPVRIIQLLCWNWDSESTCRKQTTRTIGTLIIGNLYYESVRYAHRSVYPGKISVTIPATKEDGRPTYRLETKKVSLCHQFMGHIVYTICTLGIFVIVRIIQLLCWNWNSESTCRKQTTRTIGTLIIGNLYYESVCYAHRSVYPPNVRVIIPAVETGGTDTYKMEPKKVPLCHQLTGHIVYAICTIGLFIPSRFIQLLCWNWNSESTCQKQTARTIGTLVIGNLCYEGIKYSFHTIYYPPTHTVLAPTEANPTATKQVTKKIGWGEYLWAHVVFTLCTLGLYAVYRVFELLVILWIVGWFYGMSTVYPNKIEPASTHASTSAPTSPLTPATDLTDTDTSADTVGSQVPLAAETATSVPVPVAVAQYPKISCGRQLGGHLALTLCTLGLFIPVRIFQVIYNNWNSENCCNKHMARTFGTLLLGNLWYETFQYGRRSVYSPFAPANGNRDVNVNANDLTAPLISGCRARATGYHTTMAHYILGHVALTVTTLCTFIPYRIVELIRNNWNSDNVCKKQTARTICTLVLGNLYYESICYAHRSVYPPNVNVRVIIPATDDTEETFRMDMKTVKVSGCHQFLGHIVYAICTLTLFIPVRIIQLLCWNWNSESTCRKQTVRTIGTLIIGNLWYEGICYAHRSVYPPKVRVTVPATEVGGVDTYKMETKKVSLCHQFLGHLVYSLCTLGIFIPVRIIQLLCWNWNNESTCRKQTVRTIGTLVIGNLWYEGIRYAHRSVYPPKVRVTVPATEADGVDTCKMETKKVALCHQFLGHIVYAICTLALFIPVRIIQLLCWNWNSENVCRKQTARTIGTLVIGNLWYELFWFGKRLRFGTDNVWNDKLATVRPGFCSQCLGFVILTVTTFGTFLPFEFARGIYFMYKMYHYSPLSDEKAYFWNRVSWMTLGLAAIYFNRHSLNKTNRVIASTIYCLLCAMFCTGIGYAFHVYLYEWKYVNWVYIVLAIFNPLMYNFAKYIWFHESARRLATVIGMWFKMRWWRFKHRMDLIRHWCNVRRVHLKNWRKRSYAERRTIWSHDWANFKNVTWRDWFGRPHWVEGDNAYTRPRTYGVTIAQIPNPPRDWDIKMARRFPVEKMTKRLVILAHQLAIKEMEYQFMLSSAWYPSSSQNFWHQRYIRLDERFVLEAYAITVTDLATSLYDSTVPAQSLFVDNNPAIEDTRQKYAHFTTHHKRLSDAHKRFKKVSERVGTMDYWQHTIVAIVPSAV